mmetsp:Transcript_67914/g.162108  ORF Transcript_67914/g.162108 Transcript_67914/m.162108 type:complete len:399 (+) Transcript_67914:63-1259(+)
MLPRLLTLAAFGSVLAATTPDSAALEADDVCGEDSDCGLSLRQLRGESTIGIQRHRVDPDPTEEASAPSEPSEPSEPETAAAAAAEAETGPEVESESSAALVEPDEEMDDTGEDDEGEEPMPKVNETKLQNERETEEGGLCCFSGESNKDTCASCYPMSIASYKSKCSKKNECGHCGGTWCQSTCVTGAADPFRKCQTAYSEGTSSDPVCAKDAEGCKSCQGEWCRAGYDSHFTLTEGNYGREVPEYVAPEETRGVCCYRATNRTDTCGSCADVAKDSTCSSKSRCGGCGGTWCPGPRCIKAFKNAKDPCNTAFPFTGVAAADDFCSLNQKHCSSCKGAWCMIGNITYYDGTKYDPNTPYKSPTDQRLEPVNQTEVAEAEEEVANDEGLDDLFPDGLA